MFWKKLKTELNVVLSPPEIRAVLSCLRISALKQRCFRGNQPGDSADFAALKNWFSALMRAESALFLFWDFRVMHSAESEMKQRWSALIISESEVISAEILWDLNPGLFNMPSIEKKMKSWHLWTTKESEERSKHSEPVLQKYGRHAMILPWSYHGDYESPWSYHDRHVWPWLSTQKTQAEEYPIHVHWQNFFNFKILNKYLTLPDEFLATKNYDIQHFLVYLFFRGTELFKTLKSHPWIFWVHQSRSRFIFFFHN